MGTLHERSHSNKKSSNKKLHFLYWVDSMKGAARSEIEKIPFVGSKMIQIWRNVRIFFSNLAFKFSQWKMRHLSKRSLLTNDEINLIYYVSPNDIVYSSLVEYSFEAGKGLILDGNWDRLEIKFEDLDVYVAFKDVIQENKNWNETVLYHRIMSKIEDGEILWGCANRKDFDTRCQQLDILIDSIKKYGYKSQRELGVENTNDEVVVNIGRYGDLLFSNSAHRLAIAKILGIEKIPVKIAVRHANWMNFRNQYERFAIERDAKAYQPALHPDFQYVPAHHGCEDRFEIIQKNLSVKRGHLLDIGANLGYFSSRFEDEGFDCTAVESNPSYVYCLNGLRRATNKHYKIIDGSILEAKEILNNHYDVVLALNIFHHFLKSKEIFEKFENFIGQLNCKEIYFEPHLYEESQMVNAYRNMRPEQFVEYIRAKTNLMKSELIGHAGDDRPIYKIS